MTLDTDLVSCAWITNFPTLLGFLPMTFRRCYFALHLSGRGQGPAGRCFGELSLILKPWALLTNPRDSSNLILPAESGLSKIAFLHPTTTIPSLALDFFRMRHTDDSHASDSRRCQMAGRKAGCGCGSRGRLQVATQDSSQPPHVRTWGLSEPSFQSSLQCQSHQAIDRNRLWPIGPLSRGMAADDPGRSNGVCPQSIL
jgi:hypothetical protein